MNFKELELKEEIVRAVHCLGFENLTPIQEKAIPKILDGDTDFTGLAQTGTGKTAAFGLPMLHLIDFDSKETQGLVICPTRELCLQITGDLTDYGKYLKGCRIASVYGGASIENQIRQIKKGVQIVVATPGRLIDLIRRKAVRLSNVRYVVLDEADEMLSMGFQEDIDEILQQTPEDKYTWLFSATMPKAAERIARNYMTNPAEVTIGSRNKSADNISHICYVIREKDRYAALKRLIDYAPDIFGLIFCRTRNETQSVAEKLMKDGYHAESLHGDLSQAQRDYVMRKFRERNLQILVATDVAARGLDVDDITHVINYNLPDESERYTHRSGRTARAGKAGISIVLVNTREIRKIGDVERQSGIRFNIEKVPDGKAICEKQLYALVEKMVHTDVNQSEISKYLSPVYDALSSFTKEELIQRFVSAEFNRFLDYYRNAEDINANIGKRKRLSAPKERQRKGSFPKDRSRKKQNKFKKQRIFINVGKLDKLREGAIVRLVCDEAGIKSDKIGSIDLKREFSFFEVEKNVAGKVLKSLDGAKLDGREIHVRFSDNGRESDMGKRRKRKR
jgi:ATP-dependent RNA helicase DeaD